MHPLERNKLTEVLAELREQTQVVWDAIVARAA